uniref:Uncharacterized protein n=1 Tax=Tetranychus urticae TaxID=32264 RepID=T1K752_TETUR
MAFRKNASNPLYAFHPRDISPIRMSNNPNASLTSSTPIIKRTGSQNKDKEEIPLSVLSPPVGNSFERIYAYLEYIDIRLNESRNIKGQIKIDIKTYAACIKEDVQLIEEQRTNAEETTVIARGGLGENAIEERINEDNIHILFQCKKYRKRDTRDAPHKG